MNNYKPLAEYNHSDDAGYYSKNGELLDKENILRRVSLIDKEIPPAGFTSAMLLYSLTSDNILFVTHRDADKVRENRPSHHIEVSGIQPEPDKVSEEHRDAVIYSASRGNAKSPGKMFCINTEEAIKAAADAMAAAAAYLPAPLKESFFIKLSTANLSELLKEERELNVFFGNNILRIAGSVLPEGNTKDCLSRYISEVRNDPEIAGQILDDIQFSNRSFLDQIVLRYSHTPAQTQPAALVPAALPVMPPPDEMTITETESISRIINFAYSIARTKGKQKYKKLADELDLLKSSVTSFSIKEKYYIDLIIDFTKVASYRSLLIFIPALLCQLYERVQGKQVIAKPSELKAYFSSLKKISHSEILKYTLFYSSSPKTEELYKKLLAESSDTY